MATCARCKKGLTDPISIKRGYGPVCWAKAQADKSKEEQRESGGFYDGGDIILCRENGYAAANVPHAIVLHSPTGFEWGYGGSGPADLALNILYAVTGNKELALRHYQEFKWTFIAAMPEEGGTIRRDDILSWLKEVE
jgi:hypothetical protein